jgi:transposase
MTMRFYIYRTGHNTANQSSRDGCPHRMRVAAVEADGPDEALSLARERVTCYNGQSLDAEPADAVDRAEAEIDSRVELY